MEFPKGKVAGVLRVVSLDRKSQTGSRIGLSRQHSMLELLVASNAGLSCQNFQKEDLFGGDLMSCNRTFPGKSQKLSFIFPKEKWHTFLRCFTSSKVSDQEPHQRQWAALDAGAFGGLQRRHELSENSKGRLFLRKSEEL
jgi:hypothetical protein